MPPEPAPAERLGHAELSVLAAFAEAMAPPGGPLPAAEQEIPVSASLGALSERFGRRPTRFLRAGIRAFDWLPFPRRFSTLPLQRRRAFLERLAGSRRPDRRELLMLMKTLYATNYCRDERLRDFLGVEIRCGVDGPEPPPPGELGSLQAAGDGEECDVVIVGSGAGGAAVAAVLAEAGLDVLVLEAGGHWDRTNYPDDPLLATTALYRECGLTVAEGLPPIPIPAGRMVGGTTVINSGTCFRAQEATLQDWRDRFGLSWATDLDAEFAEAEEMLSVTRPELAAIGRNGNLVAAGAARLGLRGEPLARNAGGCVQCSACPQGCRLDAKRAMHVSYLPRAVAAGARVRKGVEARTVLTRHGRAVGVECVRENAGCAPWRVDARRAVVVAGGSFGTPELLLRSGLGGPAVGRNLRLHPSTWVGARFDESVRGWEGIMQSYGVEQWREQGVMLEATFTPLAFGAQWLPGVTDEHQARLASFDRLASNGVQARDTRSRGRVRLDRSGQVRVSYRLQREESRRLVFGMARAAEIWFAAGATEVYPQISSNPVLKPGDAWRLDADPPRGRNLRLEAFHPMGTARIGSDPGTTVGDPSGAVRGARDLYVADASVFPTSLGVNPMMTVIAAATRLARGIADRYT